MSKVFKGIQRHKQKRYVNRNLGTNFDEMVEKIIQRNEINDLNEADKWKNELKQLDAKYSNLKQYIEPFMVS